MRSNGIEAKVVTEGNRAEVRLTGVNNQPPHATMIICPDAATAKRIQLTVNSERVRSPFYRSLNGDWKYNYSSNQLARVPDFWKPDFNDRDWDTIPVPSNVELFGHGIPGEIVNGGYSNINFAFGIGVTMGVYVAGKISGAHLNPAVTLTVAVFRGFSWVKVVPYMLAQTLGAFCASALVFWNYHPAFLAVRMNKG